MKTTVHVAEAVRRRSQSLIVEVCIPRGRLRRRVTQELTDFVQGLASGNEVAREGVPQIVDAYLRPEPLQRPATFSKDLVLIDQSRRPQNLNPRTTQGDAGTLLAGE